MRHVAESWDQTGLCPERITVASIFAGSIKEDTKEQHPRGSFEHCEKTEVSENMTD